MYQTESITTLLLMSVFLVTCKDEGTVPLPIPERVKLTLIDVSVKEAFIHVAVTNPTSNETIALRRTDSTVVRLPAVADTNIVDTALTEATTYQYTATLIKSGALTGTSNTFLAQTLAPTSHNFTWQTFLLGDGNNSALNDVVIIGDSLVYACGEVYLSGDLSAYNLVRWNGTSWQLLRIPSIGPCSGGVQYPPLRAVWSFSESDILLTDGGTVFRYDGMNATPDCRMNSLLSGAMNRISGGSPNSTYVVGGGGTILRFDGSIWQRLESGTTTSILDAWGVVNPVTGEDEVYCAASSFFEPTAEKKIVRITERTHVDSVVWIDRLLTSVWTHAGYPLYTSGDGMFENTLGQWHEIPTGIYTNDIRGTALNNIIAVGDFGFITHYNGIDWQTVGSDADAGYATVRLNQNFVCAVGRKSGRAIITMGKRN